MHMLKENKIILNRLQTWKMTQQKKRINTTYISIKIDIKPRILYYTVIEEFYWQE